MSQIRLFSPEGQTLKIQVQTKTHIDGGTDENGNPHPPRAHWRTDRIDDIPPGSDTRLYEISPTQRVVIEGRDV